MRLSLKVFPKLSHKNLKIINDLSFHTSKIYNIANYNNTTSGFISYVETEKLFKTNWHNDYLHSHNYQQALKVLEQDWKSYFSATKDFKKNSSKYLGKPRKPNYKKGNNQIIFTKLALRHNDTFLKLSISKEMQTRYNVKSLNLKLNKKVLKHCGGFANIQQVKLTFDERFKKWCMFIIYNQEIKELPENNNNIMSIDLGLNNLCSITFKDTSDSYLIKGLKLKSINKYYNEKIKFYQSERMLQTGSKNYQNTKQVSKLYIQRQNYIDNFLHQVSSKIVYLAVEQKCNTILIGKLKNIKQKKKSYMKDFVQVPILRLKALIEYKAKLNSIKVKEVDESYTSGCCALSLEGINKKYYKKSRRITRGLFTTPFGNINADINGSLNIMRKYLEDTVIPDLITKARANGYVNNPIKLKLEELTA